jgi:hypothetical protein
MAQMGQYAKGLDTMPEGLKLWKAKQLLAAIQTKVLCAGVASLNKFFLGPAFFFETLAPFFRCIQ